MKNLILIGALTCLMQIPSIAQNRNPAEVDLAGPSAMAQKAANGSGENAIVGTWIAQLTDSAGAVNLFEVGSFSPDGSYTGANVNGLHAAHKGVWVRTDHLRYAMTVLFFTHDAQGTFNGIVRARISIHLNPDLESYESVAERTVMDTLGKVLSVTPGIVGHSVKMFVQP